MKEMISSMTRVATILGVAAVVALSAASAQARDGQHRAAAARGAVVVQPYAYQPFDAYAYQPPGPQVYRPSVRDAHGYIDRGVGYSGTGTFSDGRNVPGTNWNPNQ
jgi:hypothetical protein